MLELKDITKSYGKDANAQMILKGISLLIEEGEFVSIMGPSGSGKSTLASILGCLSLPSSGSYQLDGQEISQLSQNELAKLRNIKLGFIFQEANLLAGMSAIENTALPLAYRGMSKRSRLKIARECLEKVGLGDKLNHTPSQLSGGQKQRVAIARALVNNPQILFADEPTGALDHKTSMEIIGIMQKLNIAGHTIVQVTHSEIESKYSKRIVTIVDGQITRDRLVEDVLTVDFTDLDESPTNEEYKTWHIFNYAMNQKKIESGQLKPMIQNITTLKGKLEAVRTLVKQPQEYEELIKMLFADEAWSVRAEIVKAYNDLSWKQNRTFLKKALQDENNWVRFLGFNQFRVLPPAVQKLEESRLVDGFQDEDDRVRATAVSIVGGWEDPKYILPLTDLVCYDPNSRVKTNAIEALRYFVKNESFGYAIQKAFRQAMTVNNQRVATTSAAYLYAVDSQMVQSFLSEMIESPSGLNRAAAAWAMGTTDDAAAFLEQLQHAYKHETESMPVNQMAKAIAKLLIMSQDTFTDIFKISRASS